MYAKQESMRRISQQWWRWRRQYRIYLKTHWNNAKVSCNIKRAVYNNKPSGSLTENFICRIVFEWYHSLFCYIICAVPHLDLLAFGSCKRFKHFFSGRLMWFHLQRTQYNLLDNFCSNSGDNLLLGIRHETQINVVKELIALTTSR